MKWNHQNTPPPHLDTVLGCYPEFGMDDAQTYQLVYYNMVQKEWFSLTTDDECLAPLLWAAITEPTSYDMDQSEPLQAAS